MVGQQGQPIDFGSAGGGPGGPGPAYDLSVNAAAAELLAAGGLVLRTGSRANGAGAFHGGGVGNKAIYSVGDVGPAGVPLADLVSLEFDWTNITGPAGPNYLPAEPVTASTPYINIIVDFNPGGPPDRRVLVVATDQLAPAVVASVGTYVNNGLNLLTYHWDASMAAFIVGAPPAPVPGGVPPLVSVGPGWFENTYSFAALVAANPNARIVAAFPADGGLPAGAIVGPLLLTSGDSGTVTKSGKLISRFEVNGESLI